MKTTTDWLTLATLIATVATLAFVLLAEARYRHQYRRVDFYIDHVGQIQNNDGRTFELFELTNCGTATATRIVMTPIGAREGSSNDIRPIRVLGPGETKRFVVEPIDDLDACWVMFTYQSSADRRFVDYSWEPLRESGPLADVLADDMKIRTDSFPARCALQWRRTFNVVETVGPHAAPSTRVRAYRDSKTTADMRTAGQKIDEWFDRWRALDAGENLDQRAADTL